MFVNRYRVEEPERTFEGILNTTGLTKEQRNFEKKHLKAYKRGWTNFSFGFTTNEVGLREPVWYKTKESWN